jgi:hypothetical protein
MTGGSREDGWKSNNGGKTTIYHHKLKTAGEQRNGQKKKNCTWIHVSLKK